MFIRPFDLEPFDPPTLFAFSLRFKEKSGGSGAVRNAFSSLESFEGARIGAIGGNPSSELDLLKNSSAQNSRYNTPCNMSPTICRSHTRIGVAGYKRHRAVYPRHIIAAATKCAGLTQRFSNPRVRARHGKHGDRGGIGELAAVTLG